jgi:GT2 family glycosyltransferase
MADIRFGVVVINWNGSNDTIAALESLIVANPRPDHVVVVDNGSADDSLARLREWSIANSPGWAEIGVDDLDNVSAVPWLLLIAADSNLGFAGGNNVGLGLLARDTSVTHFLLLNNDAMVAPDYFAQTARAIEESPRAGLLGALIYRHPERQKIWFSGAIEIPSRALVLHRTDRPATENPYPTPFVTGCAMVISRPLYDTQGGLSELYNPIYWEDGDYSSKARAAGWQLLVAPLAVVYHRVGASSAGDTHLTPRIAYLQNRNRGIYVRRNYRGTDRLLALGYLSITKPVRAAVEFLSGRGAIGGSILRGFWEGMTMRIR